MMQTNLLAIDKNRSLDALSKTEFDAYKNDLDKYVNDLFASVLVKVDTMV